MKNRRASRRETASLASRMSVVYRAIDLLKPDPANARIHSKKQIRQIANSIEAFGFNVPVLVDAELNVHLRARSTAGMSRTRLDRGADAVPRSPDPRTGPGLYDRGQPVNRDLVVG